MKGVLFIPAMCVSLQACGPPAIDGGFDSANPAAKMYATEQAASAGDRTAVKRIVEQLDSDDPAVRFLAIAALQRLTGQTYGYCDADPPLIRRQAIARWVTAVESGSLDVPPSTSGGALPASVPDKESAADHG